MIGTVARCKPKAGRRTGTLSSKPLQSRRATLCEERTPFELEYDGVYKLPYLRVLTLPSGFAEKGSAYLSSSMSLIGAHLF